MKWTYAQHLINRKERKKTGKIVLRLKEMEFLRLCCEDITYAEIAKRLKKSPRTIDCRRDNLFHLLDVKSRIGLVLWCFKTGLVKVKDIDLTSKRRKKKKPRQE
jgi:DNA-binding CsgD family transcriptional regulator